MYLIDGAIEIRPLSDADKIEYCCALSDCKVSRTLRGEIRPGEGIRLLSTCSIEDLRAKFDSTIVRTVAGKPCVFAVCLGEKRQFSGSIGAYEIDRNRIGLTYWLCASVHGKGYGTKLLNMYCEPALRYFQRKKILANVALDNPASINALRKAGFKNSNDPDDPGFEATNERIFLEWSIAD